MEKSSDGESYSTLAIIDVPDRSLKDAAFTTEVENVQQIAEDKKILINPNTVVFIDERDN